NCSPCQCSTSNFSGTPGIILLRRFTSPQPTSLGQELTSPPKVFESCCAPKQIPKYDLCAINIPLINSRSLTIHSSSSLTLIGPPNTTNISVSITHYIFTLLLAARYKFTSYPLFSTHSPIKPIPS